MKHIALIVLISILAVPGAAEASFPDQRPVDQFFDDADYVAYVRIQSGEIGRVNGDICGARYRIDVLEQFKGRLPTSSNIAVGPSVSPIEIGKSYLVFLSTRHGYDRRRMAEFIGMPEDFLSRCRTNEVFLEPSILVGEDFDGGTPSFLVPTRILAFPRSLQSESEVDVLGNMGILEPVYVPRDKALHYLDVLGRSRSGR